MIPDGEESHQDLQEVSYCKNSRIYVSSSVRIENHFGCVLRMSLNGFSAIIGRILILCASIHTEIGSVKFLLARRVLLNSFSIHIVSYRIKNESVVRFPSW